MSDDDDVFEEQTKVNVEVDDPDSTADRPRELAKALGVLPGDEDGSTLMADPDRMKRLAAEAAKEAETEQGEPPDEPPSIVSFVSNPSNVAPAAGPMPSPLGTPADAEPETMGSITLDPKSRNLAGADGDPITIEPRMGVRGIMPGAPRSPIESDAAFAPTAIATGEQLAMIGTPAPKPGGPPRPDTSAKKAEGPAPMTLKKRSATVIGLAPPSPPVTPDPDPKEAETMSDVRIGTAPLIGGPLTQPIPTTPMRERTNSDEALIAHALAIPKTGSEFKPAGTAPMEAPAPETMAIPQTPPKAFHATMASPAVPPTPEMSARTAPSNPSMPISAPMAIQQDGPTPGAMAFVPLDRDLAPPKSSGAGKVVGLVAGGLLLFGLGTGLGWTLRSARIPASAAATAVAAPASAAPIASATPEPATTAAPPPDEKKEPDLEIGKTDPPPPEPPSSKPEKPAKPEKPKPSWATAKPPPWKPPPKPSAKPAAPAQPKGFDPGGI